MRSPLQLESGPCSLKLDRAPIQQQRPSTARNKWRKKKKAGQTWRFWLQLGWVRGFALNILAEPNTEGQATSFVSFFQFLCHWDHNYVGSSSDLARVYVDSLRDHFAFLGWNSLLLSYDMILRRRQWHPTPVLLPGKSHGQRSLVGCSPWGCKESDMTERLYFHFSHSCIGEGNGNPLQCSCLENPGDGGAWWAAVYGVAQSRTRLK